MTSKETALKETTPKRTSPDDIQARVLHRDGLMLIIDKPPGLPVHRGPKGGASLEDCFDALRYGLPRAPSLAHRLDKDTSGCLVLGRHRKALAHLGLLFKHGKVGKTYWAVVEGGPMEDAGTIDLALGRLDDTRGWWMKPDPNGLPSVTNWKVLGRSASSDLLPLRAGVGEGGHQPTDEHPPGSASTADGPGTGRLRDRTKASGRFTWLALEPVTGRTHQLRVHCAAAGWPIFGDNIYGTAPQFGGPILHLQAHEIVVPISKNRPPVRVAAPVPPHMRERLVACGWREDTPDSDRNTAAGPS
jgi:tRNA pseudouridine32 synthase / 23S rRNA pseudouridine746 synthase